jgi:dethiobiotin synthetase
VGKTWVAARLLLAARQAGLTVVARKPAQSFDPSDKAPTDAEVLAAATGEDALAVCRRERWYPVPFAPPMAADHLGLGPIRGEDLLAELTWPAGIDVGIVETAGGLRSPIAHDLDSAGLCASIRPNHVVIVADAGLGTIHGVRSAVAALAGVRYTVLLNRFDPGVEIHARNREWLARRDGVAVAVDIESLVATIPW